MLILGCDPLRVYLFKDGLVRFATQQYQKANGKNKDQQFIHLTNFAINKENPNFVAEDYSIEEEMDIKEILKESKNSHKRSIIDFFRDLKQKGHDTKGLWREIQDIVVKTICSIQPILKHNYLSSHPDDPYNQQCFELLGFDILMDDTLKPYLLEVNHSPSFRISSQVDYKVKRNLIADTFKMLNLDLKTKKKLIMMQAKNSKMRTLTGRRVKLNTGELREKCLRERDAYLNLNKGMFERVYPPENKGLEMQYRSVMDKAESVYHRFTGAGHIRNNRNLEKILKNANNKESKGNTEIVGKKGVKNSLRLAEKVYGGGSAQLSQQGAYQYTRKRGRISFEKFDKRKKRVKKNVKGDLNFKGKFENSQSSNMILISDNGTTAGQLEESEAKKRSKLFENELKNFEEKFKKIDSRVKLAINSGRGSLQTSSKKYRLFSSKKGKIGQGIFSKENGGDFKIKSLNPKAKARASSTRRERGSYKSQNYQKKILKKKDPYTSWDPYKSFDRAYKERMKNLGIRLVGPSRLKGI